MKLGIKFALAGLIALSAGASVAIVETACVPPQVAKVVLKTILDEVLAECVAENQALSGPEMQKTCGYADSLKPTIERLTAANRTGALRAYGIHYGDGGK